MDQGASEPSGTDRADEALAEYLVRVDQGESIDTEQYIRDHPEVADVLRAYLADSEAVRQVLEESVVTSVPRRIAKFELIEMLGQGAFGSVFRANDIELGREVAVKTPRLGTILSAEEEERFLGEGRSAARLRHPGIVPVYEVGRSEGRLYIASECVNGITLDTLLKERQLSFRESAEVVLLIALALDHAHKHGIIHRDLKPSNIIMEPCDAEADTFAGFDSGSTVGNSSWISRSFGRATSPPKPALRPRLMDFGLAHRADNGASLTLEGQILGTPAYMSPEQARGEAYAVDGRSDIYSLGVVLYQLLVGEVPFRGTVRMVLLQVLDDEPRPPRQLNDAIPRDLETITLRCLAKEASRRYPTAGEVAAELRRFLDARPILARPVSRGERAWKWCHRNPAISGAVAMAFLGLAFGLAASLAGYLRVSRALEAKTVAEADSQDSLQDARRAVNDFLLAVANKDFLNQPGMQPVRYQLLQRATEYFDRFADRSSATLAVRLEGAENLYRLATLAHDLGDTTNARDALNRSVDILREIDASHPNDPQVVRRLGESLTCQGNFLEEERHFEEAERVYEQAVETRRRLIGLQPNEDEPRRQLANGLMNLALAKKDRAILQDDEALAERLRKSAVRDMEEAQQIRSDMLPTDGGNARLRFDLAQGYYNLAPLQDSDLGSKVSLLDKAVALFEALLNEKPWGLDLLETKFNVLLCRRIKADLRVQGGIEGSAKEYTSVLAELEDFVAKNPAVAAYRAELAVVHVSAARAIGPEGCDTQLMHFKAARSILEKLAEESHQDQPYREKLVPILERIATLQAADVDAARCTQDELISTLKCWHDQLVRLAAVETEGTRYAKERQRVTAMLRAVGQE